MLRVLQPQLLQLLQDRPDLAGHSPQAIVRILFGTALPFAD